VCDSVSYSISVSQPFTITLTTPGLSNVIDSMNIDWSVCNTLQCYLGSGTTASFQGILQTDTIKSCYEAYIYIDTMEYFCYACDSLLYDGSSWVLLNMVNPNNIVDLVSSSISAFYPNPAADFVKFNYYLNEEANLVIIDVLGNRVKDIYLNNIGQEYLYIGDLTKGIYFGNLVQKDKLIEIKKLIVR
tara:strand:- start:54 stop:617 length:564 start_codon:yes stop_codon:yes gene_type:complete